jgi:hypothetical protein
MVTEEERNPGFRNKVKEIKEQVQSEAYNGEPVVEVDRLTAQTKNFKKHNIKKRKESLLHCSFSCRRLFDFSINTTEIHPLPSFSRPVPCILTSPKCSPCIPDCTGGSNRKAVLALERN